MRYTPEEQAEHRKLWVDALRSGKYEQGRDKLRRNDKFCCLGVACDISGLGKWEIDKSQTKGVNTIYEYKTIDDDDARNANLPALVRHWLGVNGSNVHLLKQHQPQKTIETLSDANDDGFDFNQIADMIELDHLEWTSSSMVLGVIHYIQKWQQQNANTTK